MGPELHYPCRFFDGASSKKVGGVSFCLMLNESHHLEFALGAGPCTNTKAELIGLWALLHTAQMMGIPKLRIFGDSLVIINWEKGTASLSPPELYHWCRDTRKLCSCFLELYFCHIYREFNQLADCLSKKHFLWLQDLVISQNLLKVIWPLRIVLCSFELGAGACSPLIFLLHLIIDLLWSRLLLDCCFCSL